MQRQLQRLLDLAEEPNVTVRILPFAAGAHPAMHGPFTLWAFDDETVGDLACLENLVDCGVLSDREMVAPFLAAYSRLEEWAATEPESVTMIRAASPLRG
jgi:hypothetical protein